MGKTLRYMKVTVLKQSVLPKGVNVERNFLRFYTRLYARMRSKGSLGWFCNTLERESNGKLLEAKYGLFIKRDKPSLNKNIYSQELFLF